LARKSYNTVRKPHRKFIAITSMAACVVVVVVAIIGFNVAFAGAGGISTPIFGFGGAAQQVGADEASGLNIAYTGASETSVLTKTSNRNIDKAVDQLLAKEEAERKAAEEARIAEEARKNAELAALQARSAGDAATAGLDPVDWTIGHDAFVNTWAARIDAYLAGSPLEGQGATFAEAAWTYGIDPRVSPAISNTESSKGRVCFLWHNAWGWGQSSWSSWEEAIDAHVSGLVKGGYGPMITYAGAQRYCPPNYDNWYRNTTQQMALI
jgi:hypothetical protein